MDRSLFFLVFMISIFLLIWNVRSASLEYYGIEDTINEDMSVLNVITLKFKTPITSLDYSLNFKIYDLNVTYDFDYADCRIVDLGSRSDISCDFKGMDSKRRMLTLSFYTKSGVKKSGRNYQFVADYGISLPVDRAFILIKLPSNGVLAEDKTTRPYYPRDGKLMTDGKRIMVYWERENLTSGDTLQFSVLYTLPIFSNFIYNVVIITSTFIVVVVMVALTLYLRGRTESSKEEVVKSVLNPDEKTILNILTSHGGKVSQKVIVRESDFSKAKVSRLVKSLKERGIVDIEPISGRENRIILKKNF